MKKILIICLIALLASGCVSRPRATGHSYCRKLGLVLGTPAFANCVIRYEQIKMRRGYW